MPNLGPYRKAIVAAAGAVVAVLVAVFTESDPESIPALTETIVGTITALLVYLIPNGPTKPNGRRINTYLLVGLLCLTLPAAGFAQQRKILVDVTNLAPGDYQLTIDASGRATAVPITVIQLGQSPTVPDTPTDPPEQPDLSGIASRVRDLAARHSLDQAVVAEVAAVYTAVGQRTSGDSLPDLFKLVRDTRDALLILRNQSDQWEPFLSDLQAVVDPLVTTGQFQKKHFGEIATGLHAYAGNQAIGVMDIIRVVGIVLDKRRNGERIDIAAIVEILRVLLD